MWNSSSALNMLVPPYTRKLRDFNESEGVRVCCVPSVVPSNGVKWPCSMTPTSKMCWRFFIENLREKNTGPLSITCEYRVRTRRIMREIRFLEFWTDHGTEVLREHKHKIHSPRRACAPSVFQNECASHRK